MAMEAIRYLGGGSVEGHVPPDWLWDALESGVASPTESGDMIIKTSEGEIPCLSGDYVIRAEDGELRVAKQKGRACRQGYDFRG